MLPFLKMAAAGETDLGKRRLPSAVWFGSLPLCDKVSCPYDANHQMPKSSLEKHIRTCRLRKLEYSKEEEAEMYDSTFFYEKAKIPTVLMVVPPNPLVCTSFDSLPKHVLYHEKYQTCRTDIVAYLEKRNLPKISEIEFEKLEANVTEAEVIDAIMKSKLSSAPGPDGFPAKFYKELRHVLVKPMTRTYSFTLLNKPLQKKVEAIVQVSIPRGLAGLIQRTEQPKHSSGAFSTLPVEVPQNHKRFICDLTQADRLAIYDYVLAETKSQRSRSQLTENDSDLFVDLAAKVNQDDGQKGPKSHLEILAEMRDYKRRRQSYRAKNVHITKKSYTEVIRDVIGVHMEELATHWQEDGRTVEACEDEKSSFSAKSSGRKEEQRSTSADSRQSCESLRDADHTRYRRNSSRSPAKQKRSRERGRRTKERDEDRHHSHRRRK